MARLVTKFKFLKSGDRKGAGGYAKYIATREGVERIDDSQRLAPATKQQETLIEKILKDFPDSATLMEYADYQSEPNMGNASEFIFRAIEDNADDLLSSKTYADYIATRPRAQRFGSHGLFTDDGVRVQLEKVSEELNLHEGNVWTAIISLRREDAERLGFNSGERWRDMLRAHTHELSDAFHIPMTDLKWFAAFHNEGHHPHVHLSQKRVAAYCRVSTDSEEQLTSYTNQMKVYTEMIASNKEWEFAGLYADEGISGTRADKRPQFQKMIEDCHKGKIDMIITKSVSRFARNTVDCLDYVRSLKEIGVGIYFEEQNIDTLKSDSELYLVIYAGFAQSESESISKNITWTHRKNFEDGKPIFMYSRMLGYRKGEDGNPEIVPEEAAIVQRVFDMYLSGKSTDEISEILQAEKIVIPGKKLTFSKSMIIRMLKNEKYCGDAILQKTVTIDPISKKRKANEGEAPMWLVENSHPAIVTREIFNKAQEESARRKAKAPVSQKSAMTASGKYSKYALTEVMICGECGSRYKRVTWNIRGKRRIVWRCISRLDYGKKYCTESITVDEQALQRAIVRALNRFNVEDEATYLLLMKSTIGEAVGINGSSDEIDLLERRIDALNKRMLDLVSLSVQEGDDAENHEDDFKNISTQIEQLTKRITAIRESESENGDFQARLKEIQDIIDKRRENKDIYDDSIVRQMVECIKVYHDGRLQIILGGGYELEEYLEK